MPWSPDTTELVSPRGLPYDQLWATDDHGARYPARFRSGKGRAGIWPGIVQLSALPRAGVRQLDLVGDDTHLIRLPLGPSARARARHDVSSATITPGERLLVLEAERILASGDVRGPVQGPVPGEIIAVLTEAGPAPWASVIDAPVLADGPEMFAALACVLPDVDGAGSRWPG